ncbi:ATP-binding cassette domain-containing protein, partial [Streptococcus pneumoniae]
GVNLIINKEINSLYLIGYLLAAMKIKDSLDASKEGLMEIFYLSPKIERLKEIQNQDLQEGDDYSLKKFDIDLKDVEFAYNKDAKVLNGVSFKAKQGEVTALVGASGCGKTTILKLISRLYDYDKGQILIDGKDIKEISTESLFDKVSIVFQDVVLFNQSVMEN